VAYYILEDGALITTDATAFQDADHEQGPSVAETLEVAEAAWTWWRDAVDAGLVIARGKHIPDGPDEGELAAAVDREPPDHPWAGEWPSCQYCDAARLCQFSNEGGGIMKIDVITASAGAGKTYALATQMQEAIAGGDARPDAVVAITYTNKAAAELGRRLRRRLLEADLPVEAARIRDGYIGTVHSVCQRLISDLAFEAGTSPYPEPAPESYSARLFGEVVGEITSSALASLGPLVEVLAQATDDSRPRRSFSPPTWRDALRRIVESSRENRVGAEALQTSATNSVREVLSLLNPPAGTANDRDKGLFSLVPGVLRAMEAEVAVAAKVPGAVKNRLQWARGLTRDLAQGRKPSWNDLVAVFGGMWSLKKCEIIIGDLRAKITGHLSHPRLHDELRRIIEEVFGYAAGVGEAFLQRKQSERLLDFEDMHPGPAVQSGRCAGSAVMGGFWSARSTCWCRWATGGCCWTTRPSRGTRRSATRSW